MLSRSTRLHTKSLRLVGSYGCTKEVCQFQAMTEKESFKRAGVLVVGVSPDAVDKQKAFVEKQKISVSSNLYWCHESLARRIQPVY